ncbi:hypothetical protein B0H94_10424 [Salsuginibacillus halophilus]|uniref:Uncharacterized protein n=1 Tax=Salsuginibacillus halophilus TaxID=517424 RepID=A0A2P8HQG1_9BACI|nr:hypothetical protein [Salsuginibacillus halophilus]PSL48424.1 hypothetical protein B0H94_10424 [Salsuginibacillus halophilus]
MKKLITTGAVALGVAVGGFAALSTTASADTTPQSVLFNVEGEQYSVEAVDYARAYGNQDTNELYAFLSDSTDTGLPDIAGVSVDGSTYIAAGDYARLHGNPDTTDFSEFDPLDTGAAGSATLDNDGGLQVETGQDDDAEDVEEDFEIVDIS